MPASQARVVLRRSRGDPPFPKFPLQSRAVAAPPLRLVGEFGNRRQSSTDSTSIYILEVISLCDDMLTFPAAATVSARPIQQPRLNLRSIAKGDEASPLPPKTVDSLASSLAARTERYARSEVRQPFPIARADCVEL